MLEQATMYTRNKNDRIASNLTMAVRLT